MSGKVKIRVAETRGRKGRRRLASAVDAPRQADSQDAEPPQRIPRVARVLALAHHWRGLIRSGAVNDQAKLARLVGVSRARVTQVMRLLDLAPDIQEAVLDGRADRPGIEKALREIAACNTWSAQRAAWARWHPALAGERVAQ